MNKVLGSKVDFNDYESFFAIEFMDCIDELLEKDEIQELKNYFQHCNTSRFQHSLNVAYYSYLICKVLHFDYRSAARAGMLHDLFLYDWRTADLGQNHAFYHPKEALKNSHKITNLNKIEEDAILKHMWPLCFGIPRYKESVIITIADKYCATFEVLNQFNNLLKNKISVLKNLFSH